MLVMYIHIHLHVNKLKYEINFFSRINREYIHNWELQHEIMLQVVGRHRLLLIIEKCTITLPQEGL